MKTRELPMKGRRAGVPPAWGAGWLIRLESAARPAGPWSQCIRKFERGLSVLLAVGILTLGLAFGAEPSGPPHEAGLSQNRARAIGESPPHPGPERAYGETLKAPRGKGPASAKSSLSSATKITAKPSAGAKLTQPFRASAEHSSQRPANEAQIKSASGTVAGVHQSDVKTFAGVAKAGATPNNLEGHRLMPVALASGPPMPSPVVPHRGGGPAVVGGAANSRTVNVAVINGTGMKRRP